MFAMDGGHKHFLLSFDCSHWLCIAIHNTVGLECAAVKQTMRRDPNIWQRRPMSATILQYAAEDASQLLLLADRLSSDLDGAELR